MALGKLIRLRNKRCVVGVLFYIYIIGRLFLAAQNNKNDNKDKNWRDIKGGDLGSWALIWRMICLAASYWRGCLQVLFIQLVLLFFLVTTYGWLGSGFRYITHMTGDKKDELFEVTTLIGGFRWSPGAGWSEMTTLGVISGVVLVAAVFHAVARYLEVVWQAQLVQKIVVRLRSDVYNQLQRLSFRFFDSSDSGSLLNRVTTDVQSVRLFVDGVIVELIKLMLALGVFIYVMVGIHPELTLACMATVPFLAISSVIFSKLVRPAYRESRVLHDVIVNRLTENLLGKRVVKAFAQEEAEKKKFDDANETFRQQRQWIFWRTSTMVPLMEFFALGNMLVLLTYGGYLYSKGEIQVDGVVVFFLLLRQITEYIFGLFQITDTIQRSLTGSSRVFEVLDTEIEIKSPEDGGVEVDRLKGEIEFKEVRFSYLEGEEILASVDLKVKAGECLAILGATGSGKSTLLSLVPRFYDPDAGEVKIDGVRLQDYNLDCLRKNVGLVFQESFLFSTAVWGNIAFGNPMASRENIEKAAKIACAHDFIMDLPKGYDTIIGENGMTLSGGQRQRLAIARAVLLEPAILLLDDPTAAIDPETEQEILEAMDSAMLGRTTLVIAHRLSTLRRADRVIVIEGGKIVEEGTHEQLMGSSGHYRRAAELQIADSRSLELLGLDNGGSGQ